MTNIKKYIMSKKIDNDKSSQPEPNRIITLPTEYKINDYISASYPSYRHNEWYLNTPAIQNLLQSGANINDKICSGHTLLMMVVASNNLASGEIAKMLLNAGADVNVTYPNGDTLLMRAFECGGFSVVKKIKYLLKAGAEINSQNIIGNTVLIMACIKFHARVINLLLVMGADPNCTNMVGNTALMCACNHQSIFTIEDHITFVDIIKMSNVRIINKKGDSAYICYTHNKINGKILSEGESLLLKGETMTIFTKSAQNI